MQYVEEYGFGGFLKKLAKGLGSLGAGLALNSVLPGLGMGIGSGLFTGVANKDLKKGLLAGMTSYVGGKALTGAAKSANAARTATAAASNAASGAGAAELAVQGVDAGAHLTPRLFDDGIMGGIKSLGTRAGARGAADSLSDIKNVAFLYPQMGNLAQQIENEKEDGESVDPYWAELRDANDRWRKDRRTRRESNPYGMWGYSDRGYAGGGPVLDPWLDILTQLPPVVSPDGPEGDMPLDLDGDLDEREEEVEIDLEDILGPLLPDEDPIVREDTSAEDPPVLLPEDPATPHIPALPNPDDETIYVGPIDPVTEDPSAELPEDPPVGREEDVPDDTVGTTDGTDEPDEEDEDFNPGTGDDDEDDVIDPYGGPGTGEDDDTGAGPRIGAPPRVMREIAEGFVPGYMPEYEYFSHGNPGGPQGPPMDISQFPESVGSNPFDLARFDEMTGGENLDALLASLEAQSVAPEGMAQGGAVWESGGAIMPESMGGPPAGLLRAQPPPTSGQQEAYNERTGVAWEEGMSMLAPVLTSPMPTLGRRQFGQPLGQGGGGGPSAQVSLSGTIRPGGGGMGGGMGQQGGFGGGMGGGMTGGRGAVFGGSPVNQLLNMRRMSYAEGGQVEGGGVDELVQQAAMALMGQVPPQQAEQILQAFVQQYGEEALEELKAMLAQQQQGQPTSEGMIEGGGGGMSDDVPASVQGANPVALSAGEFIVPADAVSMLGDGNSGAGADVLQQMVNGVREQKTGSADQASPLDFDALLGKG